MTNGGKAENRLLQMIGICKSFSGVEVLTDVGFDLRAGEVHVLAGENGAGKSTLIKILAGAYGDYSGRILIDSQPVRFNSVWEACAAGVAVIHQELSLVRSMSVVENIFLGRERTAGPFLDRNTMKKQARKLVADLGLDIDVSREVGEYPLGIQQMVEISKALAFDSRIVVMDEPTSALTDVEVKRLFGIIDKLKKAGCGIIYISHKMEEIYQLADRITVLRDGKYMGTAAASQLAQPELVNWMIGRELEQQFPRHKSQQGPVRLTISNFSVPDPTGKPAPCVDNVSLSVRSGEILALAGLQGSGNSELLNGIFGTYGPSVRGAAELDGRPYRPANPANAIRNGISLLTNDRKVTGLVPEMSIVHNVTLASIEKCSRYGWLKPRRELLVAERQSRVLNIRAASLKMQVDSLSGGNQQKVAMAKWIETQPKVLLLDEPTRGVDVGAKHEIYGLMNLWTEQGIAIILITSEMPELLAMSDRIIVMHRGRTTAEFTASQATQENVLNAAMGCVQN